VLDNFPNETVANTALLGFDMDMPLGLDLDMNFDDPGNFGLFMEYSPPKPRTPTPTPGRHPTPAPIVTRGSAIDTNASTSAYASLITPPSSLPSAVEAPSGPSQLWTPAFLRLVSDLYTTPHCTVQRFDKTLLLARQGLDFVISYLADLDTPLTLDSTAPNSLLACVIIVQQVMASYIFLNSRISSVLANKGPTSTDSRAASASSSLQPESTDEATSEGVYIGSFEVEDLEGRCYVMKAILNVELGKFKKVLMQLEESTEELIKNGKEEGKLAHLILVALKARLSENT